MHTLLPEGEELAAVDLGSNSFHLVVARYENGQLQVIDRLRETVRLAAGLSEDGTLSGDKRRQALACLAQFGQRIAHLPDDRVWAVGTNTVRKLKSPRAFLIAAETALGHPIEIVSGREEARLIYLGVAHGLPESRKRRLVVDIGGGSTEFIIGEGYAPIERESLQMGCVASTLKYFPGGEITRRRYDDARASIALELQQFAADYKSRGWKECWGSSGTIKAIGDIAHKLGEKDGYITKAVMEEIRDSMIRAGHVDAIKLPSLSEDRRGVIVGGAVILHTVIETLGIKSMQAGETAMREGLLWDMVGRAELSDPREATIQALCQRYSVDDTHAERVERSALTLFDAVAATWQLDETHRTWLHFAARVHEIGLAIAHSQHHQHAEYILAHSDLAGFTRLEQQVLAVIVRGHRRGIPLKELKSLPSRAAPQAERLMILLRLAALLHRSRVDERVPKLAIEGSERALKLALPERWLQSHPLTQTDLEQEKDYLAAIDFKLVVKNA
ncbi:MAG TPA: Ppx/GppA phosphatase family protein [Patescibacteria group bacterium]|nr:Ppx/GppA phosphatase family protein [Patescibacteria group bacterium]